MLSNLSLNLRLSVLALSPRLVGKWETDSHGDTVRKVRVWFRTYWVEATMIPVDGLANLVMYGLAGATSEPSEFVHFTLYKADPRTTAPGKHITANIGATSVGGLRTAVKKLP